VPQAKPYSGFFRIKIFAEFCSYEKIIVYNSRRNKKRIFVEGLNMDNGQFKTLISEIKNWGPSPFAADSDEPLPFTFHNEMDQTAGTGIYTGFGKPTPVFLILTSFRIILYEWRKGGTDRCRSYWHDVDFGQWQWKDPDGFVISGMKTSAIEFDDPNDDCPDPTANWQTYFISPTGEQKVFESVKLSLKLYNYHQEERYVMWNEIISIPGYEVQGKTEYPAAYLYGTKIKLSTIKTGSLDLDALWLLHNDPFEANNTDVGSIPPDSLLHPDKAQRSTTSKGVSKVSRNTGRKGKKARQTAKKAVQTYSKVKGVVDTAQKMAKVVGGGGSAVKGTLESVKQAAQSAQSIMPRFCGKCGAPLKTRVLFCGNCGNKFAQKVIEEVKGELKGKVEEKVIEKVEEALDDKDKPKGKVSESAKKPEKAPQAKLAPKKETPTTKKTEKPTKGKCPNCNRRVQPKWKFCPDCNQELAVSCNSCGEAIERGWKFCPNCTAEL